MANKNIEISIIIPCRNEEKFIETCINSALAFDMLKSKTFEILVIDGMSTDKTRHIVETISSKYDTVKLIDNPGIIQVVGLNKGIKSAKGNYILRLDAHSSYPSNYLTLMYETSSNVEADNVGGVVISKLSNYNYQAYLVQALTTHPFGVGNSEFRLQGKAAYVDTVPYGFFRKETFIKYGYYDERLERNEDYEFNRRIIHYGGKVYMNPQIQVSYYNQTKLYNFIKKQFVKEGPANAYTWYLAPYSFAYRHCIPGVFALGVIIGILSMFFSKILSLLFLIAISLYFFIAVISSIQQAIRYKKSLHTITLPLSFFLFHFFYGLGILIGLLKLLLNISPVQKYKEPWKGAGYYKVSTIMEIKHGLKKT